MEAEAGRVPEATVREVATAELTEAELADLRELFAAGWPAGDFDEDDWAHAMGGRHWLIELDGRVVSHAAVVERIVSAGGHALRTGYVEAVATLPGYEGRGLGSRVVAGATEHVRRRFELGALGTDRFTFYGRLGWQRWQGPTAVRTPSGELRTPQDDGYVMVLLTPSTPPLDTAATIACDWRPGDVW
jgi:aminoglycoside 2'-N-acetyltransferase I